MTFIYNHKLITERNTGHTILDTKNVIVDCVHTLVHVTTGHIPECHLRRIDAREVQGTGRLRLADVEAEWPRVHGSSLEEIVGKSLAMRSEERRVGKECRIGCRSRWSP